MTLSAISKPAVERRKPSSKVSLRSAISLERLAKRAPRPSSTAPTTATWKAWARTRVSRHNGTRAWWAGRAPFGPLTARAESMRWDLSPA